MSSNDTCPRISYRSLLPLRRCPQARPLHTSLPAPSRPPSSPPPSAPRCAPRAEAKLSSGATAFQQVNSSFFEEAVVVQALPLLSTCRRSLAPCRCPPPPAAAAGSGRFSVERAPHYLHSSESLSAACSGFATAG
jgi:hypothetical protein